MYKVYRDPEGKSVTTTQQATYTFQCSEDTYKEQIEKLREENIFLKNKVSNSDTRLATGIYRTHYTHTYVVLQSCQ